MFVVSGISSRVCNIEINGKTTVVEVKKKIADILNDSVYFVHNGKRLSDDDIVTSGIIHIIPRLLGGKGGFGSMLRAIGAQIEKTTNREACRDLSGRRLRDINEEKRLKNWIAQQAEREREAAERKRKKLERLHAEPKHNFQDEIYEVERTKLTEKVSDAVEQGFKLASSSGSSAGNHKRKAPSTETSVTEKKKTCLWLDPDEEDLSSSIESDSSDDEEKEKKKKSSGEPSVSDSGTSVNSGDKSDAEK